jgi:hypothetical protein
MVRQFEQQRNQDLCLLVDLWQPENPSPKDLASVELAVSFAATIVADRCRRAGSHLITGTAAQSASLTEGPASNALLQEVMLSLAVAEASPASPLHKLLGMALEGIRSRTSMVLVSTRPIDLHHPRFADLWSDPRKKALAHRILTINASSPELDQYFQPE